MRLLRDAAALEARQPQQRIKQHRLGLLHKSRTARRITGHARADCLFVWTAPGVPFCQPGTPWGAMGAAGRVRNQFFKHLGVTLGPYFESFLGSDGLNSMFLFGLVSWSLSAWIC